MIHFIYLLSVFFLYFYFIVLVKKWRQFLCLWPHTSYTYRQNIILLWVLFKVHIKISGLTFMRIVLVSLLLTFSRSLHKNYLDWPLSYFYHPNVFLGKIIMLRCYYFTVAMCWRTLKFINVREKTLFGCFSNSSFILTSIKNIWKSLNT